MRNRPSLRALRPHPREALAAGRPAVVPDGAGPAEIVDQQCGRRYRTGDAAAAAQAVTDILTDPELAARLGRQGRRRAEARFERGRQRAAYRAALAPLLGRRTTFRTQLARHLALVTVTHNSTEHLGRLLASVDQAPRRVRIVYFNPVEHESLVATGRVSLVKRVRGMRPGPEWSRSNTTHVYEVSLPGR